MKIYAKSGEIKVSGNVLFMDLGQEHCIEVIKIFYDKNLNEAVANKESLVLQTSLDNKSPKSLDTKFLENIEVSNSLDILINE